MGRLVAARHVIQQRGQPTARLPRLVILWLAVAFCGLVLGSSLASGSSTQPQYVPTATFTRVPTRTSTCVPTATPAPGGVPYHKRMNAGGLDYFDYLGRPWDSDRPFAPCGSPYGYDAGAISATDRAIAGTPDPALYRSYRYGNLFSYKFLAPNGDYEIILGFAEVHYDVIGRRRFSVAVNGTTMLSNLDVFAEAGGQFIALDRTLNASVTNGLLTIEFINVAGGAMVSKVQVRQILPATPTPTITITPTPSRTGTPTATRTHTPSATASATPTLTPTATATETPTRTRTPTRTATETPSITPTPTETGTPTATATSTRTGTATATATVTLTPTATPTAPLLDPYEPNDTYSQATFLTAGNSYSAYVQSPSDSDFFAFDVPSDNTYVIAGLTNLPADFDLFLDDASHAQLAASTKRGMSNETIIYAARAGRHYLRVTGFDHAWSNIMPYYLHLRLAPPDPVPYQADPYEPNDSMAEAYRLSGRGIYTPTISSGDDLDWFALDISQGDTRLTVRLSSLPADYDLFLFEGNDPDAMPIGYSMKRGTADEEISTALGSGRYHILALGYDRAWSTTPYVLTVSVIGPTPTPSVTPTRTATATASATGTHTHTPTVTRTPSVTGTPTRTPTLSATATRTPTATATATEPVEEPTPTETPEVSPTRTGEPASRIFLPVILYQFFQ